MKEMPIRREVRGNVRNAHSRALLPMPAGRWPCRTRSSSHYLGLGYYNTYLPPGDPAQPPGEPRLQCTPNTRPYQAEIAQGRLESLLNFQTVVTDLTGMEVGCSILCKNQSLEVLYSA